MIRVSGSLVSLVELTSAPFDAWLLVFEERPQRMGFRLSFVSARMLGWISDSDRFRLGELFMYDFLFGIFRLSLYVRRGLPNETLSFWAKLFEIVSDGRLLGGGFVDQAAKIERFCLGLGLRSGDVDADSG